MKNIHVLPTDKPSNITIRTKTNELMYSYKLFSSKNGKDINVNQHIYITSDEEIKKRDCCINPKNNKVMKVGHHGHHGYSSKKIILTTDQDLIKDGVQAIDDEFLEWFVKNPSCEEVEVIPYLKNIINPLTNEKFPAVQHRHFDETKMIFKYHYKIINPKTTQEIIDEDFSGGLDLGQIIPKEEPKQDRTCNNKCSDVCGECQILESKPLLSVEWLLRYIEDLNNKGYTFIPSSNKEIVEHVKQMEKGNMIAFLKFVFQQDGFDYEQAYNNFLKQI